MKQIRQSVRVNDRWILFKAPLWAIVCFIDKQHEDEFFFQLFRFTISLVEQHLITAGRAMNKFSFQNLEERDKKSLSAKELLHREQRYIRRE